MENNEKKPKREGFGKRLFAESRIFRALTRFSDAVYDTFANSVFGRVFNGYGAVDNACKNSVIASGIRSLLGFDGRGAKAKRKLASAMERSLFVSLVKKLTAALCGAYMPIYGMFFASFGAYTLLVSMIRIFALGETEIDFAYFLIPFVCIPMSVPMFIARGKRIGDLIANSGLLNKLLFNVLGLRKEFFENRQTSGGRKNIAFVCGMIFGAATYFLPPLLVVAAPVALLALYVVLLSPEAGLVVTLFLVPLLVLVGHPSFVLAVILLYILLCYFIKVARGKRYIRFEAIDLFMLLFFVIFALGGVFGASGGISMALLLYLCLMTGYFLCANILASRIWLKRGVYALLAGGMLSSLFAIYQYVTGDVGTVWLDTENFSNIAGRAVSFFENPNMLGEYAMMLLPLAVALLLASRSRGEISAWLAVSVCTLLCLIFTWARGAWLGAIAAFLVFAVLYSKKAFPFMLLMLVLVPFLPVILPENIVSRITSIGDMTDSSTSYRFYIYKSAFDMIADLGLFGIGVGAENFSEVYVSYAYSGIESAPHSHNLFFQLIIELGIPGILTFLAAMFTYLQSTVTGMMKETDKWLRGLSLGCACGVFASLVQGMTDYIWYNYRVYFVFFAIIGIGVAARRCGEKERERETVVFESSSTGASVSYVPVAAENGGSYEEEKN